jgi:hypothetical protein
MTILFIFQIKYELNFNRFQTKIKFSSINEIFRTLKSFYNHQINHQFCIQKSNKHQSK